MDYLRKDEALLEDLLNRILDTPEDATNIGLYMIKQQAKRIEDYRAQEAKAAAVEAEKKPSTLTSSNVIVKTPVEASA